MLPGRRLAMSTILVLTETPQPPGTVVATLAQVASHTHILGTSKLLKMLNLLGTFILRKRLDIPFLSWLLHTSK